MQKLKCSVEANAEKKYVKNATYQCPDCGAGYCDDCASEMDYECDCIKPPRLEKI